MGWCYTIVAGAGRYGAAQICALLDALLVRRFRQYGCRRPASCRSSVAVPPMLPFHRYGDTELILPIRPSAIAPRPARTKPFHRCHRSGRGMAAMERRLSGLSGLSTSVTDRLAPSPAPFPSGRSRRLPPAAAALPARNCRAGSRKAYNRRPAPCRGCRTGRVPVPQLPGAAWR